MSLGGTRREGAVEPAGRFIGPEACRLRRRAFLDLSRETTGVPATRMVADASPVRSGRSGSADPHFPISDAGQGGPMNPSKELPRARPSPVSAPEVLEDRHGPQRRRRAARSRSCPAAVDHRGAGLVGPVQMSSSLFTPARRDGKITLGIDVTAHADRLDDVEPPDDRDAVKPEIVSVTSSTGQVIPVQHTRYYAEDRQGQSSRQYADLGGPGDGQGSEASERRRRTPCRSRGSSNSTGQLPGRVLSARRRQRRPARSTAPTSRRSSR